jgi:hypothetical protein
MPFTFTGHKSFTFLVIYTEQTGFDRTAHTNYTNGNKKVVTY